MHDDESTLREIRRFLWACAQEHTYVVGTFKDGIPIPKILKDQSTRNQGLSYASFKLRQATPSRRGVLIRKGK